MRQYKVLIADDTELIRRSLCDTIPWRRLHCEVCAAAENGRDAWELICSHRPDIVILDIRMPGLDGLEVAGRVSRSFPQIKMIMITGYAEFEYARQAVRLHVQDFVLKPLRNEELIRILEKITDQLAREEENAQRVQVLSEANEDYRRKWERGRELARADLFHSLAEGSIDPQEVSPAQLHELGLADVRYFSLVMRLGAAEFADRTRVRGILREQLGSPACLESSELIELELEQDILYILVDTQHRSVREMRSRTREAVQRFLRACRERELPESRLVMGTVCVNLSLCVQQIIRSRQILQYHFFTAKQPILYTEEFAIPRSDIADARLTDMEGLLRALQERDEALLASETDRALDQILETAGGELFRTKCLLSEICMAILRRRGASGADTEILPVLDKINGLASETQARAYIHLFMQAEMGRDTTDTAEHPIVRDAIRYLHDHYSDAGLSLTELAEHLTVNPSYLSRLIKDRTGSNFTDILTQIRIERAKKLLGSSGVRIMEIPEKVGYGNYEYFFQVFKKWEGISPSQYRRELG